MLRRSFLAAALAALLPIRPAKAAPDVVWRYTRFDGPAPPPQRIVEVLSTGPECSRVIPVRGVEPRNTRTFLRHGESFWARNPGGFTPAYVEQGRGMIWALDFDAAGVPFLKAGND